MGTSSRAVILAQGITHANAQNQDHTQGTQGMTENVGVRGILQVIQQKNNLNEKNMFSLMNLRVLTGNKELITYEILMNNGDK